MSNDQPAEIATATTEQIMEFFSAPDPYSGSKSVTLGASTQGRKRTVSKSDISYQNIQSLSDAELISLVERAQSEANWSGGPSWGTVSPRHPEERREVWCDPSSPGESAEKLLTVHNTGYDFSLDQAEATVIYLVALHEASPRLLALAKRALDKGTP